VLVNAINARPAFEALAPIKLWTSELLQSIVDTDQKKRYSIENGRVRANQGHSTEQVDLTFKIAVPPIILYHGTNSTAWTSIKKQGLLPQNRHHVHLSTSETVASQVGSRRKGQLVLLSVDAKRMLADGHVFRISENEVWLVDSVPSKYLKEINV
jgi:putative RNA 2'-phosphotransferase